MSLGNKEFIMPEDPVEQERFKCQLIATAKNLKKKQQQLPADQDLLTDRWTEVLAAKEYGLERPTKSYPKRRLLPQLEEEALKPTLPVHDAADWPPVAETKRRTSPKSRPHPVANQTIILRPGATRRTCEMYWKTKQDSPDRSMDLRSMPQCATMAATPDIINTNLSGPNTVDQLHLNCVAT